MSDLNFSEKKLLEKLLKMDGGYVLDFSDRTFSEFFRDFKINIDEKKYQNLGFSKARKLKSFWAQESNELVGKVLRGMLDYVIANGEGKSELVQSCVIICKKLLGEKADTELSHEEEFLKLTFKIDFDVLPIDRSMLDVIRRRLVEIEKCFKVDASLSVIFLCGSTLEGLLLDHATRNAGTFNKANASPKDKLGNVKRLKKWSLSDLINVAFECGLIKLDVKEHGHSLRKFRNYIHPFQQALEKFDPDSHTANISCQVLKAAIADLSGLRSR